MLLLCRDVRLSLNNGRGNDTFGLRVIDAADAAGVILSHVNSIQRLPQELREALYCGRPMEIPIWLAVAISDEIPGSDPSYLLGGNALFLEQIQGWEVEDARIFNVLLTAEDVPSWTAKQFGAKQYKRSIFVKTFQ